MLLSVPAFAQLDFSGEWAQYRVGEGDPRITEMGDYFGVPLSAAGRARADNTNIGTWSLPEYQCRPHPAPFYWRGTGETRITKVVDPVTRLTTAFRVERKRNFDQLIYLDGRPHPPEWAAHTWGGFSTGKYEGDMLTITTTHIKEGYIGMNGMPSSDRVTITERWIRHGDLMTVVQAIDDPVYLEETFFYSNQFKLDLNQQMQITPCVVISESPLPKGVVPHFLPGSNSGLTDYATANKLPLEALKDGAKTAYPEYQLKFKKSSN
jgi:hypothetical protein